MVEISAAKSSSIQIEEQAGEMKLGRNAMHWLLSEKKEMDFFLSIGSVQPHIGPVVPVVFTAGAGVNAV